ncbi:MobC family replication-relaxation protein (plasmid) [Klebsiella aerogenes]|uniref:MobC family replication-relaxation protein n=1 Tax=Klebsiella aerogenes TaxID=548 RepID=UPI002E113745|nr:MobC family replication-relaxation protein [Klebsiella aerogenes]
MALERYNVSHAKRQARNAEKTRLTLRWLREELCSTAELVAQRLGIAAVQPVYRFLDSLVAKGLLVRAKYPVDGRQISVWGLTPHGVAFSFDEDEPLTDIIPFQPSRVSAAQLPHRLAVQSLRLAMEGRGATGWRYLHRIALKGMKVPDALAELDGRTVAFEVERTVKSRRRYQEVVSGYLFNRRANGIDEIWYICPDRATQVRVQRAILAVDEIVNPQTGEARKTAELDRERLFACFKFMTTE